MDAPAGPGGKTLAAFFGAILIGGSNFVAVKFSNDELDPVFGAALRFAAATVLLFVITRVARIPLPRGRAALGAALYGLLGFGFAYGFMYFALVGLGAGTTSVFVAATPLLTLVLAVAHKQERFTTRGIIGGLLALAGIAVLSARSIGGDIRPIYSITALLAVMAIAESTVVVKGFPRAHPLTTNAVGMATGATFLAATSLVLRETWALPDRARTWFVLTWLVVVGSILLFALFLYVVARWTASATVYALTVMPVVAVVLAALVADEPITLDLIAGGALVMLAVYVGALSSRTESDAPPAPAVAEEV